MGGARLPDIRDILTHGIGVGAILMGESKEKISVILEKGFSLGTSITKKYMLQEPTSTVALVRLLEGEPGTLADDCKEIFRIQLTDLPPEANPTERIEVKLELTPSGILRCYVRDTAGKSTVFKEIEHKTGLSKDEVQAKKRDLDKLKEG